MNRAERRALKFNHQTGGLMFTRRGMQGNKGKGKIKPVKRSSMADGTIPASYNTEGGLPPVTA